MPCSSKTLYLDAVLLAFMSASGVFAQISMDDEWKTLRAEAVQLFVRGDKASAIATAERVARLSADRFGSSHWRAIADRLRATYYADRSAGSFSEAAAPSRRIAASFADASDPAVRALAEDMAAFLGAISATQSRDLLRPTEVSEPSVNPVPNAPATTDRVALLIGNNDYRHPDVPKLNNAINDSSAIGQQLVKAGFTATLVENADFQRMSDSIDGFIKQLRPGSAALFYYSGHAIQIQNENFLIPVDFRVSDEGQAKKESFSLSRVHQAMVNSGAAIHIVILDACRNNAFSSMPEWFRLAPMPLARNSLIAFSTEGGRRASDGKPGDGNGPYAKHLLAAMDTPGLEIREVFKRVKKGVMGETGSQREQQVPWAEDHLLQDFYFYPPRVNWNARDGLEYLFIPKGTFLMGCVPSDEKCLPDEKPEHPVSFTDNIWIGRTEVTVGAYKLFSETTKRRMPMPIISINDDWRDVNHPIVKVSWSDADAFCRWAGGRLPSEAEWEYSARGGQVGRVYGEASESKWRFTRPSTESASNGFGFVGASENAEEWVADWYDPTYFGRSPDADPRGPQSGKEKVVRGGSWVGPRRLSARLGTSPDAATSSRGFRCVLPARDPAKSLAGK